MVAVGGTGALHLVSLVFYAFVGGEKDEDIDDASKALLYASNAKI